MSEMTGAQALINSLAREEVNVMFGIPGVQTMDILDAVYNHDKIRWITVRHEQTAGYMAFGYARTTGKEGVAAVVPGPGVLNATAALGTAYAASVPVLLIAGQIESNSIGKNRGALHEMDDQLDVFRPITKWSHRVSTVENIPEAIHTAFHEMRTGRNRPVELEIPLDYLPVSRDFVKNREEHPEASNIDKAKILEAAKILSKSEYPLIVAGGGVISSNASEELTQLAELLNAPVITTDEGKGSISEDHYLSLGSANSAAYTAISRADTFLVIGSRVAPRRNQRLVESGKTIIQIDIDPDEIGKNQPVDFGIEGDAYQLIQLIMADISDKPKSQWKKDDLLRLKQETENTLKKTAPLQFSILRTIRDEIGNGILVPDVTTMGYWCQMAYPVYEPRTYLSSSYFGTLGYAFPTALGAKIGNPDKPVMALCGDGGFLYAATELATAIQEGINTVTLVLNNNAYGTCEKIQRSRFGGRLIGTHLYNPNFARLAESFGAVGIKLQGVDELADALKSAVSENQPVVIELPVPDMINPW
ncbi:thiamine pyrophosphate-dependent enzyme [Chloroflexota bacterium]